MKNKELILTVICLLTGMAASIWVVNLNFLADSDVANSPTVWHEITQHGWSVMRNWRPTIDNWYFSAYPIHFLLFELTGGTSPEILRWLSIAQLFLCAVLAAMICYERSNNSLSFLLVPFFCGLSHYAQVSGYVAHPFSHNLTNLYGLLCVYLYLVNLRHRSLLIDVVLYLLVIAASVSDPWLLAAFYLPLLLVNFYEIFGLKIRPFKGLVAPVLTGIVLFTHSVERIFHLPVAHFSLGSPQQMIDNARWLLYGLGGMLNLFVAERDSLFMISAAIVLVLYLSSINKPSRISNVDFLILMSVFGISSAFILSSTPGAYVSARFFVNIVYLIISVIFLHAVSHRKIMLVPLLILMISGYASNFIQTPLRDSPSISSDIIAFMQAHNLDYGYGPYWGTDALATGWRSDWHQIIRPVTFDTSTGFINFTGRPQTFDNWYQFGADKAWKRQFVAIYNDGEQCRDITICLAGVKKQFGQPDETLRFRDTTFYIYNKSLIGELSAINLQNRVH
jgi:hypothetical protein